MGGTCINVYELFDAMKAVAGQPSVERLRREKGGHEVTIPARAVEGNWLVTMIGLEKAHQVCEALSVHDASGSRIELRCYIPLGAYSPERLRKAHCRKLIERGVSTSQAAQISGVTVRTSRRIVADLRAEKKEVLTKMRKDIPASTRPIRIGMLEKLLMEGASDIIIASRLHLSLKEVAKRRTQMRGAGMLPVNGLASTFSAQPS